MKKLIEYTVLLSLGFATLIVIAAWQNHKMAFQQFLYPFESAISRQFVDCQNDAPNWLKSSLIHALSDQGGLSAQITYVSPLGEEFSCAMGLSINGGLFPVTQDSRYRYASLTKIVTSATLIRLLAERRISHSTRLIEYFPELDDFADERVKDITLAHLLNHEAGFVRRSVKGDPMFSLSEKPWCPDNLNELQRIRLDFSPGTARKYSNLGYCLLGEVISRVSGKSYKVAVDEMLELTERNILWASNTFLPDEVSYDYRFENHFNDSYLNNFDFGSIASSAGLTGSAKTFALLIKQISQQKAWRATDILSQQCELTKTHGCYNKGVRVYQPTTDSLMLYVHEGYLPGSASVAIIDDRGGVTVLVKSGANRPQNDIGKQWIHWFLRHLSAHYRQQL